MKWEKDFTLAALPPQTPSTSLPNNALTMAKGFCIPLLVPQQIPPSFLYHLHKKSYKVILVTLEKSYKIIRVTLDKHKHLLDQMVRNSTR